jgi:hypothetical protein
MNVHLLRSPELNQETYQNVLHLLQQYNGPISFIACEDDVIEFDNEVEIKVWKGKKEFEKSHVMESRETFSSTKIDLKLPEIKFPFKEKKKNWDQLFTQCEKYRASKSIPENDLVILLTDIGNDINWFGGVSESMKNYFVQTSNWGHFFGYSIDIRFPIAYEVISWVMRFYMFSNREAIWKGVHGKAVGCIMDFCEDKSLIILKMRTADVCEDCMNKFIDRDIPTLYSRQFFEILDGIRNSMTFRGRSELLIQPSRLEIRGKSMKIFFIDLGGLELRLNPKEKALYLLYLNNPDGIQITHLLDYEDDLTKLYISFTNQSEPEVINRAIKNLINPQENDINVVMSRINKKIKDAVGESLSQYYIIKGERGEKKRINIDREMVIHNVIKKL